MMCNYHLPTRTNQHFLLVLKCLVVLILDAYVSPNELLSKLYVHTKSLSCFPHLPESQATPNITTHPMLTRAKIDHSKHKDM